MKEKWDDNSMHYNEAKKSGVWFAFVIGLHDRLRAAGWGVRILRWNWVSRGRYIII